MYNVPILFIIFKRFDTTKRVFQEIRKIRPQKLYIAADAGRSVEEQIKCDETRSIVNNIDWDCEVHVLYQDKNCGCKYGPYKAINWFFENEKEGIILEDDCLPNHSFFMFVKEMLEKYRNDNRIGMIAGHNPININLPDSYVFSRFKGCWGWATWKRSWINIDLELKNIDYANDIIPLMVYDDKKKTHWRHVLKLISQNKVAAWDWPWYFSLAAQNQLCIFPNKNLIANIGFGEEGTHCIGDAPDSALETNTLKFPLKHPLAVFPNREFEYAFEKTLNLGKNSIISIILHYICPLFPRSFKEIIKKAINYNG